MSAWDKIRAGYTEEDSLRRRAGLTITDEPDEWGYGTHLELAFSDRPEDYAELDDEEDEPAEPAQEAAQGGCVPSKKGAGGRHRVLPDIGTKFGELLEVITHPAPGTRGRSKVKCRCKCGDTKWILVCRLKDGTTVSCGHRKKQLQAKYLNKVMTPVDEARMEWLMSGIDTGQTKKPKGED